MGIILQQSHLLHAIKLVILLVILVAKAPDAHADGVHIRIIATTDLHATMFPFDFVHNKTYQGGLARVKTYVDAERSNPSQHVILLDNGDVLQGQPAGYYYNFVATDEQHLISRIMNHMQFDAASVGNHDIETGPDVYNRIVTGFEFPWLAANAVDEASGQPYFQPYTVVERQGVRIAILGLITPNIPNWLPKKLWEGLRFTDMYTTAKYWVNYIRVNEKPDAIIGLFHSGAGQHTDYDNYVSSSENAAWFVARNVPGFDVIFTAHDHIERNEYVQNTADKQVLLIAGKPYGRSVAVADLFFTGSITERVQLRSISGEVVSTEELNPCLEFETYFADDFNDIKAYVEQHIGEMGSDLKSRESYFGNSLFTDFIHQVQLEVSGADISIAAPLSYDVTIKKGPIYLRDMFKLYQFENYLYVVELSGQEIKKHLEYSYGLWFNTMNDKTDHLIRFRHDENGHLIKDENQKARLQNAFYNFDSALGINYSVDVSKEAGNRITITTLSDGSKFNIDRIYRVAFNSYRGSGGGGHLTQGAGILHEELQSRITFVSDKDLRSHLTDYILAQKTIKPIAGDNWVVIPADWAKSAGRYDYKLMFGAE